MRARVAPWRHVQGGEQRGPAGEGELVAMARSGARLLDAPAWTEEMANREPSGSTRVAAALGSGPASTPPPPLAPQAASFLPVPAAPWVERKSRIA